MLEEVSEPVHPAKETNVPIARATSILDFIMFFKKNKSLQYIVSKIPPIHLIQRNMWKVLQIYSIEHNINTFSLKNYLALDFGLINAFLTLMIKFKISRYIQ